MWAHRPSGWREAASWALLLVALAAMGWALRHADLSHAWSAIVQTPAWVWALSVGGLVCSHLLRAARVRLEWSQQLAMTWPQAWALIVGHAFWTILIPMRAGEAYYVLSLHQRAGIAPASAIWSLLRLRTQDMSIVGSMAVLAIWPVALGLKALVLLVMVTVLAFGEPYLWKAVAWIKRRQAPMSGQPMAPPWRLWALACANWCVKLSSLALVLHALTDADWQAALAGALGGEFGAAMPLQPPVGVGTYEAGVVAFHSLVRHPELDLASALKQHGPHFLVAALVMHLVVVGVTLVSGLAARLTGLHATPMAVRPTASGMVPHTKSNDTPT